MSLFPANQNTKKGRPSSDNLSTFAKLGEGEKFGKGAVMFGMGHRSSGRNNFARLGEVQETPLFSANRGGAGMLHVSSGRNNFAKLGEVQETNNFKDRNNVAAFMVHPSSGRNNKFKNIMQPQQYTHNFWCDNCSSKSNAPFGFNKANIIGIRYKCSMCPDYDLCSACIEEQEKLGQIHDRTHLFFRISHPEIQSHILTTCRSNFVHPGYKCSQCAGDILGFRFECIQCMISICEACEAKGKHDPQHPRIKRLGVNSSNNNSQGNSSNSKPTVTFGGVPPPPSLPFGNSMQIKEQTTNLTS